MYAFDNMPSRKFDTELIDFAISIEIRIIVIKFFRLSIYFASHGNGASVKGLSLQARQK